MSPICRWIALTVVLPVLLWLAGCDGGQTPGGGPTQRPSDGDPTVTRLPADVRAAYHTVMEAQITPDHADMKRALAAGDLATVSARARALIAALKNLEREHGRCPVEFVTLHRRFRHGLESVVEFSDGAGDRTQLNRLLGDGGSVGKSCVDCHEKYLEG